MFSWASRKPREWRGRQLQGWGTLPLPTVPPSSSLDSWNKIMLSWQLLRVPASKNVGDSRWGFSKNGGCGANPLCHLEMRCFENIPTNNISLPLVLFQTISSAWLYCIVLSVRGQSSIDFFRPGSDFRKFVRFSYVRRKIFISIL